MAFSSRPQAAITKPSLTAMHDTSSTPLRIGRMGPVSGSRQPDHHPGPAIGECAPGDGSGPELATWAQHRRQRTRRRRQWPGWHPQAAGKSSSVTGGAWARAVGSGSAGSPRCWRIFLATSCSSMQAMSFIRPRQSWSRRGSHQGFKERDHGVLLLLLRRSPAACGGWRRSPAGGCP